MFGAFDVDRSRLTWWLVGLALAVVLGFVLYSFIGTFVFGLFIFYATRPVYQRLKRRVGPPSLAAAISIFTLALPFMLLGAYTGAIGLQELREFLEDFQNGDGGVGPYESILQPYFDVSSLAQNPETLLTESASREILRSILVESQQYFAFILTALLHLFIMTALAFYLLRDGHRLSRWFRASFGDDRGVLEAYVRAVDQDFSSIFFGNILNAFITGVIGALTYSVLNVYAPTEVAIPYAALVGLLAGAASLIPVVGMKLVYVPVGGYLLFKGTTADATGLLWFPIAFFAVSFVVVDVFPDLVLRPYVSGRNLHVGTVMFAYILGPLLFGWYGLFLGPVILVLTVHFARLVLPELLNDERLQPYAVDPTYFTPTAADDAGAANPESGTTGIVDEPGESGTSASGTSTSNPSDSSPVGDGTAGANPGGDTVDNEEERSE